MSCSSRYAASYRCLVLPLVLPVYTYVVLCHPRCLFPGEHDTSAFIRLLEEHYTDVCIA